MTCFFTAGADVADPGADSCPDTSAPTPHTGDDQSGGRERAGQHCRFTGGHGKYLDPAQLARLWLSGGRGAPRVRRT